MENMILPPKEGAFSEETGHDPYFHKKKHYNYLLKKLNSTKGTKSKNRIMTLRSTVHNHPGFQVKEK